MVAAFAHLHHHIFQGAAKQNRQALTKILVYFPCRDHDEEMTPIVMLTLLCLIQCIPFIIFVS